MGRNEVTLLNDHRDEVINKWPTLAEAGHGALWLNIRYDWQLAASVPKVYL